MGGGKTVATLTSISKRFKEGSLRRPVLVIAPLRVAQSTWPDEVKVWDHLSNLEVRCITGNPADRALILKSKNTNIFTINYENLPWLVEQGNWNFDLVVADEMTKLKSFRLRQGGSRARALGHVAHSNVKEFWGLTGTPAPNGLLDLWGQTWFLDKGERLGRTFSGFTDRWFNPHWSGFGYVPRHNADKEIKERLSDIYLSVKAEDYFPVTVPIFSSIFVDLPSRARKMYKDMEREMLSEIGDKEISAVSAADKSLKCLQIANGAIYNEDRTNFAEIHDEKLQTLERLINDWQGENVLIAYHFKHDAIRLLRTFKKARLLDKNPETICQWNRGEIPILLVHPQSAGHGLNLQHGGRVLVFFGHWWNNEEREQVIERIGPVRQAQSGYTRTVHVYDILSRDTVDEIVQERHKTKKEINDLLLGLKNKRGIK